jgi:hypothetical protein
MAEDWGIDVGVPDVGDIVIYHKKGWDDERMRVTSWLRERKKAKPTWDHEKGDFHDPSFFDEILYQAQQKIHGKKLEYCYRDEAEFVGLHGVGGTIAPVGMVEVVGKVDWPKEYIDEERNRALGYAAEHEVVF